MSIHKMLPVKKAKSGSRKVGALRDRAERLLSETSGSLQKMPTGDVGKLTHELEVHQVELDMQNESLRQAQLEIQESRSKYADLYDFVPIGYFVFDPKGRILEVNLTGARLLGVERKFLINEPFFRFVMPEYRNPFHAHQKQVLATGTQQTCELQINKRDGTSFYASLVSTGVRDREGNFFQCRSVLADITERKRMEEEIGQSRDELEMRVQERTAELVKLNKALKVLSSQLLSAQEDERKRIAGEVHDAFGAALSAIKLGVENVLWAFGDGKRLSKDEVTPLAQPIIGIIQSTLEEVRRIQHDLRPPVLDDFGIVKAINWFSREFQKTNTGIVIEQLVSVQEPEIPEILKTVIYRITQEALNNIARHSRANLVRISLSKNNGAIELAIEDNGTGFDLVKATSVENTCRGSGLSIMRERTELSGGIFTIKSITGEGTTIHASWPT